MVSDDINLEAANRLQPRLASQQTLIVPELATQSESAIQGNRSLPTRREFSLWHREVSY